MTDPSGIVSAPQAYSSACPGPPIVRTGESSTVAASAGVVGALTVREANTRSVTAARMVVRRGPRELLRSWVDPGWLVVVIGSTSKNYPTTRRASVPGNFVPGQQGRSVRSRSIPAARSRGPAGTGPLRCADDPVGPAHRLPAAGRVPRARGRRDRLRAAGRGEPAPRRRARGVVDPVRHHARRARRGLHGRHVRRAHGPRGRLRRHPGAGGAQPDARGRERAARLPPARRDHGAGGARPRSTRSRTRSSTSCPSTGR